MRTNHLTEYHLFHVTLFNCFVDARGSSLLPQKGAVTNQAFSFTHPCIWTLCCFTDYLHNKVPFRLEKENKRALELPYKSIKVFASLPTEDVF